mmetsp:Transcript_13125/g.29957  ORF Transcript_13125/g.29957 Transcript_13125/m.29957 type:complete len:81 (-) Transcript_13125:632-874(-)
MRWSHVTHHSTQCCKWNTTPAPYQSGVLHYMYTTCTQHASRAELRHIAHEDCSAPMPAAPLLREAGSSAEDRQRTRGANR